MRMIVAAYLAIDGNTSGAGTMDDVMSIVRMARPFAGCWHCFLDGNGIHDDLLHIGLKSFSLVHVDLAVLRLPNLPCQIGVPDIFYNQAVQPGSNWRHDTSIPKAPIGVIVNIPIGVLMSITIFLTNYCPTINPKIIFCNHSPSRHQQQPTRPVDYPQTSPPASDA